MKLYYNNTNMNIKASFSPSPCAVNGISCADNTEKMWRQHLIDYSIVFIFSVFCHGAHMVISYLAYNKATGLDVSKCADMRLALFLYALQHFLVHGLLPDSPTTGLLVPVL